ncbi:MAG: RNA 2',3'-cyclic phosphodiesterase [Desulfobulbus sp.]|jgi:2'-5' RNA ligase
MTKRLFVALDPPAQVRDELTALCTGLPDVRWTPPEQLHLTLCFIGEVSSNSFLDIQEALQEVTSSAFTLKLKGLGLFPPRRTPRVLWTGVQTSSILTGLQRKVTTQLRHSGITLEKRKFIPHITLARLQEGALPRLQRYLGAHALFNSTPFMVEHFTLYSSVLGRNGATHLAEAQYALSTQEQENGK